MMKIGTRTQFSILLLMGTLIYCYWVDVAMSFVRLYSLTGSFYSQRMLGEYHSFKSLANSREAEEYFRQALANGKEELQDSSTAHKEWVEYFIGTQYSCGKGVKQNKLEAKKWYEKSAAGGLAAADSAIEDLKTND